MSVSPLEKRDSAGLPLLASGDTWTPCVSAVRIKSFPTAQRIDVLPMNLSPYYILPTAKLILSLISARVSHKQFKSRRPYELKGAVLLSIGHGYRRRIARWQPWLTR